jgi:hypothetical protein
VFYIGLVLDKTMSLATEGSTIIQTARLNDLDTEAYLSTFVVRIADNLAKRIGERLTLALEAAFQIGGQPVTTEVVESVLAKDINDLESKLTRHGYGHKALADILDIGQSDVRKPPRGQLPPGRALELQGQMLKAGLPL